jgi:serine phosphatase RsbU (regulator of sigma subunit)/anti-sigma regulatory factor (Ser/Thr protein kinase)
MRGHETRPPKTQNRTLFAAQSDCTITLWSATAESLLGHPSAEVLGQGLDAILASPSSFPRLAVPSRGRPAEKWTGVVKFRSCDGAVLPLRVRAEWVEVVDGLGPWLTATTAPVGQGGDLDAALMRWLYEASPIALAAYSTDLRLLRQTAALSRMTADPRTSESRGSDCLNRLTDSQGVTWGRRLRDAVASGSDVPQQEVHGPLLASSDRDGVFVATAGALTDEAGRTIGMCTTLADITERHRARRRLTLLNESSVSIGTTLDVQTTADELAAVLCPRLTDWIHIDLLESVLLGEEPAQFTGEIALRRAAHKSLRHGEPETVSKLGEVDLYPAASPPVQCMVTGRAKTLSASDAEMRAWLAADPRRAARFKEYGWKSVMVVPLAARGTILGVAVLLRSTQPPFAEDDLLLAEELTSRAAVCLDNARRYARERDIALTLQRSLLPRRPRQRSSLETASRYLPADTGAGVGGDWFDVIPLSGKRLALVVGDVVGHGINAAATMGRLRTAVRTLADVDLPPDELLTHLDDVLIRLIAEEADEGVGPLGATALYTVYDPISRTCAVASAGHPTPAVIRPDGTAVIPKVPTGPPLGVGGLPFESVELPLPDGSLLALYSDGVLDARRRDVDEAQTDLCRALSQADAPLDALCAQALDRLLPDRPADDATLLLARAKGLASSCVAVLDVPPRDSFVSDARAWAAERLDEWGLTAAGFVTELVVSELVTNAIRYGQAPIQLRLINDETLICEVSDSSTTAPHMRRARVSDEGGRGLLLVAQLTQRWGTRHSRQGKTIWCEHHPAPGELSVR